MRYQRVLIHGELLTMMFMIGVVHVNVIKGLPLDSKFAYAYLDHFRGVWVVFESNSFPELKDGDPIPEFPKIEVEKL